MYIKEIELTNFKSFARKVKVPFYDDFTTISGPNGSGKSNIIDSILFCLGLSSSRTLRAEKLTDLIYSVDGKGPGTAEVTIRFDNKDRELPIDQDEVTVTRRIKSSDSGYYSYYYFNDKPCSLNEVHEQLAKAKISPDGYNVIMQGDVTRIISMSDGERRKIIDEIAGTAEFDEKTDKALSELDVVRERIERVNIILAEVETRLAQLKAERDQAMLYKSYRDEKVRNEGFLLLSELMEAKQQLDAVLDDIKDKTARREAIVAEVEAKAAAVDRLKADIKALSEVITRKGEGEQIRIRREIEEARAGVKACTDIIEFSKSEITGREREKQKLFLDIEAARGQIEGLNAKIAEEEKRKISLNNERGFQQAALGEARGKISAVDTKFQGVRTRLAELKNALEAARNGRNETIREKDRILDAARRKQDEEADSEAAITSGRSDIESARVEVGHIENDIKELQKRAAVMTGDIADMESARARAKQDQLAVESRLRKLQEEYARAEGRVKAYEESEGYSQAVETILSARGSRELPGIYGTIAELGKVDDRYAMALEVAAGNRLQNIVVDNDEDASRCIYYLKDARKGTATFLPLNRMRSKPSLKPARGPGIVGYAIDLIDYDAKYENAFWYVFGDTVVVDDLEIARSMIGTVRMVTLDGDLVEKSGAMTGGFRNKSKLKFKASEEEKIRSLAEQITVAESERDQALAKVDSVDGHIYSLKKDRSELESQTTKLSAHRDELKGRTVRLEHSIREKEAAINTLRDERRGLRDQMIQAEDAITKADAQIAALSVDAGKLEEELKGSEVPKLTEDVARIEQELNRLDGRLRDAEAAIAQTKMEQGFIENRVADGRRRLEEIDQIVAGLRDKIAQNEASITAHQERMSALGKREQEIDVELVGMKRQRDEMSEALSKADHDLYDARRSLERVTGLLNTMEIARDESIEKIKTMEEKIAERGVIPSDDVPPVDRVRANITVLERKMHGLEPVNMLAITEYDAVDVRLKEMTGKRDTLTRERQDLLDRIEHYKAMKKETFMNAFNSINENFKTIFHDLSDGFGELVLESAEDPFAGGLTIRAQPHGKALQRLDAMSGGEKSLTAMAFIFAIQRHRPAPFYAFDEVDMFLDGANAERVARMIKSLSKNAQFIVVSLRKPMIESANRTIGIAMQENNISSITGVRLYGN
jgi:chromosome segregation protein